ncbi:MAG TPA: oligopeptide/dipeptide ABC transporter ATP-binding protein, partial [Jatrophihabitantaceae bacterium]|nr:oligopeptide/dipeptide ABC transporter ATP-binding protein [Jatrophihabitantaceae bacterium]
QVPSGCVFHPRCRFRDRVPDDKCRTEHPELLDTAPGHSVRCHIPAQERRDVFRNEIVPTL